VRGSKSLPFNPFPQLQTLHLDHEGVLDIDAAMISFKFLIRRLITPKALAESSVRFADATYTYCTIN
jgi:hypothetical protein